MSLWKRFKEWLAYRKYKKMLDKRLKELKESDPFIYD
jgi:hypothetical protein